MTAGGGFEPLPRARRALLADLGSRAGRERQGRFLLEGPRAIEDALARGVALEGLVVAPSAEAAVRRWQDAGLVPAATALWQADEVELAELADTKTPQGVLAVGALPPAGLDALAPPDPLTLLVDGVQDPGNLGTLLRTLAAVGGRAAICCKGTVDPFNPKALRGSAGAALSLQLAWGVPRAAALAWCEGHGVAIVALAAGGRDLFGGDLPPRPLALAVGGEAAGLSPEVEAAAALVAGIPMEPGVESLSAAVAGSVALYALACDLVHGGGR